MNTLREEEIDFLSLTILILLRKTARNPINNCYFLTSYILTRAAIVITHPGRRKT
jgi:hypothetical protein